MQNKVYNFVKKQVENKKMTGLVLDIGSLSVNGSLRSLFCNYTGLDMRPGDNVDVVASSHAIPFNEKTYDIVTCVEMLEHDDNPFKTLEEIYRVLKVGGWVIVTASGISFPKHDHPSDYFRYTKEGLAVLLRNFDNVEVYEDNDEVYGVGKKINV